MHSSAFCTTKSMVTNCKSLARKSVIAKTRYIEYTVQFLLLLKLSIQENIIYKQYNSVTELYGE